MSIWKHTTQVEVDLHEMQADPFDVTITEGYLQIFVSLEDASIDIETAKRLGEYMALAGLAKLASEETGGVPTGG